MANEFKIKNGFLSEGNSQITGSLIVTGGITGSLQGTATTASFVTASNVVGTVTSASYALSASYAASITLGGNNQAVQFNNNGTLGGFSALTYDSANYSLLNGHLDLTASGKFSHAEGTGTTAFGRGSHVEGSGSISIGDYSHAEGNTTFAGSNQGYLATTVIDGVCTLDASYSDVSAEYISGDSILFDDTVYDAAYGLTTFIVASSSYSGSNTLITLTDISVTCSQAIIGNITYGIGNWSGGYPIGGYYSHAEGNSTQAIGYNSHVEGQGTQAIGEGSHAEGRNTVSLGPHSHAEGNGTQAIGGSSHAEGNSTQAIGVGSHAEGAGTQAIGDYSHTEGTDTIASGNYSHAEGNGTVAQGDGSHAEGNQTIASGSYQHVSGQYNTHGDTTSLFIIGNGVDDNNRKDAFKVTPSGSIVLPTTVSSTPGWTGVQGEMIFGDNGAVYKMHVWLNGGWRSVSLA